jgi:fatty-acyl-CoA synthase
MDTTFPRLLAQHARQRPGDAALREKEYGIWQTLGWADLYVMAGHMAQAFAKDGLQRGEHVLIVGANRPRLYASMLAVQVLGGIPVPLYQDAVATEYVFPINNADVRFAVVENQEQVDKLQEIQPDCPTLSRIYYDDPRGLRNYPAEGLCSLEAVLSQGAVLAASSPQFVEQQIQAGQPDDVAAMFFTSGTTGNPKGVVVHHRGAYLNAVGNVLAWNLPRHPVYLWTLPMFHCNGWCFPWTLAAVAGTSVCLRRVDPALIFELMREHHVTHYCGAPIVHATLIAAPAALRADIDWQVKAMVAGASPPAAMIEGMAKMGFDVTHVYGLTEVYGPAAACAKHDEWTVMPIGEQADLNARQGMRYQVQQACTVIDPQTGLEVPRDATTMGEVVFRGNIVMKGYLKNEAATREAFAGGWFHTGDLGVLHPDGYVKLKDRAKDIIISGGENISSIEVEDALYRHPAVMAVAVIARPDEKWGETPLALVELRPDFAPADDQATQALAAALIEHCRQHLARFKCPREIRFMTLPKTSTGKIQKHLLRTQLKSASAIG